MSFQYKLFFFLVYSKPQIIRNPIIKEQALARIYQIRQIRKVTTIHFYICKSFKERVIET